MPRVDASFRLNPQQLPALEGLPNDEMLRTTAALELASSALCELNRRYPATVVSFRLEPFEEGAAEMFADRAWVEMFGLESGLLDGLRISSYQRLREAVEVLAEQMGGWVWLEASRVAPSQRDWLRESLEGVGYNSDAVRDFVAAQTFDDFATRAMFLVRGKS